MLSGTYPNPGYATTPLPQSGGTLTGALVPAVVTLTDASTIAVNAALGNDFRLTLSASGHTLGAPSNPVDGQRIDLMITQGTGGSFTMSYNAAYLFSAGLPSPTLSTAAGTVDILGFVYSAALSGWMFVAFVNGFT